jgi:hypothetical protein
MAMLKEKVQQVVGELPEDVDVDALVEKLTFLRRSSWASGSLPKEREFLTRRRRSG